MGNLGYAPLKGGVFLDWRVVLVIIALICFVVSFIVAYRFFYVQESSVPSKIVEERWPLVQASGIVMQGLVVLLSNKPMIGM